MKKITYPLFLAVLSGLALPEAAKAVCLDGLICQTSAGTLTIDMYEAVEGYPPFLPPGFGVGSVRMGATFNQTESGKYRFISAITAADGPTVFFDRTLIAKPLLDIPPGGYMGMPPGMIDLLPYSDTQPGFENQFRNQPTADFPTVLILGGKVEARFETWLVEVVDEVFGDDPTKARDDIFTIDPLAGWTWGYDIQNTNNGNANLYEVDDFLTTAKPFSWLNEAPTEDWMSALNRVYGTGETEDRFNVAISPLASIPLASIIEPSSVIGLIGLGILGVGSIRKRKS